MRKKLHEQLPFLPAPIVHERAREYAEVSRLLDRMPQLLDLVDVDVRRGASAETGRPGLSAEQIQRALVVKQAESWSYEQLAFHVLDSTTLRWFCRLGAFDDPPAASTWQENIKRVSTETLDAHLQALLGLAKADGIEDGAVVRGDCTVVETNIHHPTDSSLLWDAVRVLTRILKSARDLGVPVVFTDHRRRARRRNLGIATVKGRGSKAKRRTMYIDLLKVVGKVVGYAQRAAAVLDGWWPPNGDVMDGLRAHGLAAELRHYLPLVLQVVAQTERRVLHEEKVPVADKLFSLFESHTDLVVKGSRETEFGHKVFLASGRSGLVTDVVDLEGNPADTTLLDDWLARHVAEYGNPPSKTAFDGGFASKANLDRLKRAGVSDAVFHKKRGIKISDMARSTWVYRKLRRFRAGIESVISFIKRCFGWTRCTWRGRNSFKAYVRASVLAANLFVYARHRLAEAES